MTIGKGPGVADQVVTDQAGGDYLWNRSGPVDEQVAALERLLGAYALREQFAPQLRSPSLSRSRRPWRRVLALAAVLSGVAIGGYGWYWQRLQWPAQLGWPTAIVRGEATLDGHVLTPSRALQPGGVIQTGDRGVARIQVARIGEVLLGRDSRLRLVATRSGQHRVQLEQGTLWARIWAPPGSFGVGVPSGEALDMGCEFLIRTDAHGNGHLQVSSGWVQFENAGAEIFVPQGAQVVLYAHGPGTPYVNDAAPAFITALEAIDRAGGRIADAGVVQQLLAASRREDAITLLSLLSRYPPLRDGPVFDRAAALLPPGVTREALAEQGPTALNPWWRALPYPPMKRWWLKWPDAIGAVGNAQSRLRYDPP